MKKVLLGLATTLLFTTTVNAQCFGSDSYRTCTDANGNTTTTLKSGSFSSTTGSNSRTGTTWNSSTVNGHTTGSSSNGARWNATQIGKNRYYNGTTSSGKTYSKVCNQHGCY